MDEAFALLRASGFPVDWRTVCVGWRGIQAMDMLTHRLTGDAVSEHAREVLADAVGTPDEYPVFLLADAAPGDWETIERHLSRLAERSGVSEAGALRIWRYARLLLSDRRLAAVVRPDGDLGERLAVVLDAAADWGELVPEHPLALGCWHPETEENLAEVTGLLRRWLAEERHELLGG